MKKYVTKILENTNIDNFNQARFAGEILRQLLYHNNKIIKNNKEFRHIAKKFSVQTTADKYWTLIKRSDMYNEITGEFNIELDLDTIHTWFKEQRSINRKLYKIKSLNNTLENAKKEMNLSLFNKPVPLEEINDSSMIKYKNASPLTIKISSLGKHNEDTVFISKEYVDKKLSEIQDIVKSIVSHLPS